MMRDAPARRRRWPGVVGLVAFFAFIIVGEITENAVMGAVLMIGVVLVLGWQTTAKLTRDDPVDTDWYWHFKWLLLAGVLLAVGLAALATGGTKGTAGTRAVGGGLTVVALVLLMAGCRDLRHWLEQRDEGRNGYPGDAQP